VRQDQVARLLRLLDALNAATAPESMNVPGFGFHGLRGKPKRYAVSLNGPWRVTFGWEGKDAVDADLEQYH
jgi:proteic killer suppression protein